MGRCVLKYTIMYIGEDQAGYVLLQPGGNAIVTLTLMNIGNSDNFTITISTDASPNEVDFYNYVVTPNVVSVQQNMTAKIAIQISLYYDTPIGLSVTFTVVAQSVTNIDVNDYITFDVTNAQTTSAVSSIIVFVTLFK